MAVEAHGARLNALSVDVEEHFHVEAFAGVVKPADWPGLPSRVVANTQRTLELFARYGAKATFFLVGWVAERHPDLVKEIVAAGHEVGCHSYWHRAISRITPEQFREDTRRAVGVIEQAASAQVRGYRAPTFSISTKTLWALEILAEEGFLYDSSVFPVRHDLYGMPDAPRFFFQWCLPDGRSLYEMPMTTVRVWGRNWPASGGGWLRILPLAYTRWALGRVIGREQRPVILYFHPWEIDREQPRMNGPLKSRLRHYTNLSAMESRLGAILSDHRFACMHDVLQQELRTGRVAHRELALASSPAVLQAPVKA